MLWAGQGDAGSGKTHFLMTAPEPIFVQLINDVDGVKKLKGRPEFKKRDIRAKNYSFNLALLKSDEERMERAEELIDEFLDDYRNIGLKNARTIGWDKEDLFYEMLRFARFGDLKADKSFSYRTTNDEYRGLLQEAGEAGVSLGLIRAMKEKWSSGGPTGVDVARGQREVREMVDVVLHHRWDNDLRKFVTRLGGNETDEPKLRVGDVEDLIGREFESLDFPTLASLLYPHVSPEEWGL